MIYRGTTNQTYSLVQAIAHGGEGTVYTIDGNTSRLAKIYHSSSIPDFKQQEKILNMVLEYNGEHCRFIAWPLDALYNENMMVCGFVMKRFPGVKNLAVLLPEDTFSWDQRVLIAHNLCDVVREIHDMN